MAHSILKVIITDDDDGDRMQIASALDRMELACEWTEAVDIDAALAACAQKDFDCAIVDYRLPGRDGLEGVTVLNERYPYMPIVMATSHGNASIATEAMKRGASDYIAKGQVSAVSLRRIIENAVEKAAMRRKLAQQREELERFADILVHDLKSPIASIRAFTRIMEIAIRQGASDQDKFLEYCLRLSRLGERMSTLIDTLHDYTRLDATIAFQAVEMTLVMSDTLNNLAEVIGRRAARVSYGELPVVYGNAVQLTQLLQNLIGNSIKYCEAPVPTVDVGAAPYRSNRWLFSVDDNGIGVAEGDRQRIFGAFQRLHDRSRYDGTGLGLATCRKIVERHGGEIWCTANAAKGTTFCFDLPAGPDAG